jgi:mannitol-1-/sugar-/sorbitol-6-phosphatase
MIQEIGPDRAVQRLGWIRRVCDTGNMKSFIREAILFDLDGVLVDSTACAGRIWKEWARENGLDPEYMVQIAHGRPTIETVRMVAPHLDAKVETARIEEREVNDVEGLKAVPGAKELLESLPPDRFAIVTSGSRRLASARLRAVGIRVPEKMIAADDIVHGKPDPEPYLQGARLIGFAPHSCLVFEDSPPGIRSAKAAGMAVIGFPTTYPVEALAEADFITESFNSVQLAVLPCGELKFEISSLHPCACS